MNNVMIVSDFDPKTQQLITTMLTKQEEVVLEELGQPLAVIISSSRYQTLLKIAHLWVKERFLLAQQTVHQATMDIPLAEIEKLIAEVVRESRQHRGKHYAGRT
jgi:PHD/YefM family antitoxin component YafN of YafNO toxin-antitoxin module